MKKKIKYIVISVLLLLVTGCSGNYNVKINEDMSVNEELYLTIENKEGLYQKTLKIFNDNNVKEKDYEVVLSDDNLKITYNASYNSIEEYILNSKVYHQLIDNLLLNKPRN